MRRSLPIALLLVQSCYSAFEPEFDVPLPEGTLTAELFPHHAGPRGSDVIRVAADGTFTMASVWDAQVCHGELTRAERRLWRRIEGAMREDWERPETWPMVSGHPQCATLLPDGRSDACLGDAGARGDAFGFAESVRRGRDDAEACEALPTTGLTATIEVAPDGAPLAEHETWWLEWHEGRLAYDLEPGLGGRLECDPPSENMRRRLDDLAQRLRDALTFPREDELPRRGDQPRDSSSPVAVYWMGVIVDSPFGRRGHRIFTEEPELARELAELLAAVCGLETR
ncbi:MAG: hypothetical protein JJ863_27505 [Deltaproteobacteria bacterium]|nr:hypothetical protein [Deltaproteobacteria bacterium]